MTAFDRLAPSLGYHLVHTLGFQALRPVQELTIPAVLDGKNSVVLAPTAGGKTEAAFFPLLSAMDAGDWAPTSLVYVSPIRALLNDQEDRVQRYAAFVGRRAAKWHGDVAANARAAFRREPTDVLLTTPESLEVMLTSPRFPKQQVFAGLRAIVIDEAHAFAAGDRGGHLMAVLERLQRFSRHDIQRVGLSATVGNPAEVLAWMQGSSRREGVIIDPPRAGKTAEVVVDYVGSPENAAAVIAQLHVGKKRLVFADSRRRVERLGQLLQGRGVEAFVLHGSLSSGQRREAEGAFREGTNRVIVSTSALELGIDVGDLDQVLQINCPGTVASFLQRMGRTGRRAGTSPNTTFLVEDRKLIVQTAALVSLWRRGFIEPVRPLSRAFHLVAHQLLALARQLSGVSFADWGAWVEGAAPFRGITLEERAALVGKMLEAEILADHGGRLWLGPRGEKLFGRRNFEALYAVFSTPEEFVVFGEGREIGTVERQFVSALVSEGAPPTFTLAGRPWQVAHIDWEEGRIAVKAADHARAPRWHGSANMLGYELCQEMRRILLATEVDPSWSRRAEEQIAAQRAEHAYLADDAMVEEGSGVKWFTFAGGRANLLLARMLERDRGGKVSASNVAVTWRESAEASAAAMRAWVGEVRAAGRPLAEDVRAAAALCAGVQRFSKFQPCLTEEMVGEVLGETVLDREGARRSVRLASGAAGEPAGPTGTSSA